MECQNCGKEIDGTFGSGRFCSRSCANRKKHTEETKSKISESVKAVDRSNRSIEDIKKFAKQASDKWKEKSLNRILTSDYNSLSYGQLKKRIILEQEGKCNVCGLDSWLGKPIVFEFEHKDGNRDNNERNNLEVLCPNCHSLTDTWRGRNKNSQMIRKKHISDDEIVEAFIKTGNIRQTLIFVGLAPKGANYGRVKRALTLREIIYI